MIGSGFAQVIGAVAGLGAFAGLALVAWLRGPVRRGAQARSAEQPPVRTVPGPRRPLDRQWRYCPSHGSTADCACTRGTAS